jgi:hypothetical protein
MRLKVIIAFVVSIIAFAVVVTITSAMDVSVGRGDKGTKRAPLQRITNDVEVSNELTAAEDFSTDSISIMIGTYSRKNTNNNEITIYVNSSKVADRTFNSSVLLDNRYYTIDDIKLDVKKGDKIKIDWITKDGNYDNSVSPYADTGTTDGSKLYIKYLDTGTTTAIDGKLAIKFNKRESVFKYALEKYGTRSPVAEIVSLAVITVAVIFLFYFLLLPEKIKNRKISDDEISAKE